MESVLNWSVVISIIGVLVALTNIIVQVVKKAVWDKLPTNILAVIVSMALTLVTFFAYCQIKAIAVCGIWLPLRSCWGSWWRMQPCSGMTSSWRPSARLANSN